MGIEEALNKHHDAVMQEGELLAAYIAAEKARLEAERTRKEAEEKAKTSPVGTQIIQSTQPPLSKRYEVRDIFKPLEELVQQGPGSVGGAEVFRDRVLKLISSAAKQIYPDLGGDKWEPRDDGGWSNNQFYLCINCNAVQRRDNKERLTTPAEYALIREAFRSGNILLNQDTSSCSERIIEGAQRETPQVRASVPIVYAPPPTNEEERFKAADKAGKTIKGAQRETPQARASVPTVYASPTSKEDEYSAADRVGKIISKEIEDLKGRIGGEWHETDRKNIQLGSVCNSLDLLLYNSLYLFCPVSQKAYLRRTGEPAKLNPTDVAMVMNQVLILLAQPENFCPAHPDYGRIIQYLALKHHYTLPKSIEQTSVPPSCIECRTQKR